MNNNSDLIVKHIPPTEWYEKSKWQLVEPLVVNNYIVPKDYITDGASVPLILTIIFSPTGKYMKAAVIHDYLLDSIDETCYESRHYADKIFLSIMESLNVPKWRRITMYLGVRFFGIYKVFLKRFT